MSKQLPKAGENWFGILDGKVRMFTIKERGRGLLAVRLRDSEWGAIGHYVEDGGIKWLSRVLTHEEAQAMRDAIKAADDFRKEVYRVVPFEDLNFDAHYLDSCDQRYILARAKVKIGEEQ